MATSVASIEALKSRQVSLKVFVAGDEVAYEGLAYDWDTHVSDAVALTFDAPWYKERTLEVFVWADMPTSILLSSPEAAHPESVTLQPTEGQLAAARAALPVLDHGDGLTQQITLVAKIVSEGSDHVFFGVRGRQPGQRTGVRDEWVMGRNLAVVASTWAVLFAILFLLTRTIGGGALAPVAPVLALVPSILSILGFKWADSFKANEIALRVARDFPRWMQVTWVGLGVAAACLMGFVVLVFVAYAHYRWQIEEALDETTKLPELAELFCRYPDRKEVRATLARKVHSAADPSARANLYGQAARHLKDRFEGECVPAHGVLAWLNKVPAVRRDDARTFYASLWWNGLDKRIEEFYVALEEIRKVLKSPPAASRLAALSLAKYETRLVLNLNQSTYCRVEHADTEDCRDRQRVCAAKRNELLKQLRRDWESGESVSVAYLEARDAAGMSLVLSGCAAGPPDSAELAIEEWRALMRNVPAGRYELEDHLAQLNFRKLIDGVSDRGPDHESARAWQADCIARYKEHCEKIKNFVADKQTFVGGTLSRQAEWASASMPALERTKFAEKVRELAGKDWKWPL